MKYKFIGKPDKIFPHLKTGKVYDLTIEEHSRGFIAPIFLRVFWPYEEFPVIIYPIRCPYSSWQTFHENWELVSHKEKHV